MTRRRTYTLLAVALAAILGGWLLSRRMGRKPAPKFDTMAADRGPVVAKVTASGTLSALVTVQVGSQVSGRISALHADFNSQVKKGQVIAKIDPQLFEAAVEQARANLMAAQGNLAKAKAQATDAVRQAKRERALADQKLVAIADAETAEANADAANASVEAAQGAVAQATAALDQARVNLAYTTIVSPTNGTVISRNIDVGQTVAASFQSPTLFVIAEDLKRMQVDTSVAEADVGKLRDGMPATFTVDAFPGDRFQGTVRQIRNAATTVQNVVTYDAVIDVSNPDLRLRPGMTANVTFVYAQRDDALRVPNAALRFHPSADVVAAARADGAAGAGAGGRPAGGAGGVRPAAATSTDPHPRPDPDDFSHRTVWVLRGGKAVPVPIQTGISDGTTTEVVKGALQPGDACIIDAIGSGSGTSPRGPRGPL